MSGNLRKLTQLSQWRPRARERALWVAIIAGPLSLLLSLLLVLGVMIVIARTPKPVDVYRAIAATQRAEHFASDSLLLVLAGNSSMEKKLIARKSDEESIPLSINGFEVFTISPVDVQRYPGTDGAVEWVVTLSATRVVPGTDGVPRTNNYLVTLIERNASFQLLTLPRIVNPTTESFTVASAYTAAVDKNGALGKALNGFVTAYLTTGQPGVSLRDYISAQFTGSPITDSPYNAVDIEWIRALNGSKDISTAKPGDVFNVLVRVRASASQDTWTTLDIPVQVSMADNANWWVDGFDSPLQWGKIK